jgi:hypothetical protein
MFAARTSSFGASVRVETQCIGWEQLDTASLCRRCVTKWQRPRFTVLE